MNNDYAWDRSALVIGGEDEAMCLPYVGRRRAEETAGRSELKAHCRNWQPNFFSHQFLPHPHLHPTKALLIETSKTTPLSEG